MPSLLYCWLHRDNHSFTQGEVEKIVYSLGAAETDAYLDGARDPETALTNPPPSPTCLQDALRSADNPEVYAEHVEQGVECRRAHQKGSIDA